MKHVPNYRESRIVKQHSTPVPINRVLSAVLLETKPFIVPELQAPITLNLLGAHQLPCGASSNEKHQQSVLPILPKYRLGHPENYVF